MSPAQMGFLTLSRMKLRGRWTTSFLTAVLGADAVADSPLEVGLGVGLDEGVDWADVSLLVTAAAISAAGRSDVLLITADADELALIGESVIQNEVARGSVGHGHQGDQKSPQDDLAKEQTSSLECETEKFNGNAYHFDGGHGALNVEELRMVQTKERGSFLYVACGRPRFCRVGRKPTFRSLCCTHLLAAEGRPSVTDTQRSDDTFNSSTRRFLFRVSWMIYYGSRRQRRNGASSGAQQVDSTLFQSSVEQLEEKRRV